MSRPDHDFVKLTAVLAGCRRRERGSQRQLYEWYYGLATSICRRYLRDPEQAMEAVNDGFLKIFRDVGRFDIFYTGSRFDFRLHLDLAGSFRAWLRKIMVRTAIDHFRAIERYAFEPLAYELALQQPDPSASPPDTLAFEELIELVHQLPPAYHTVFNLYAIDGFTHEEIARQLGISVGTSKSNLFKARAYLKNLLKRTNHHGYTGNVG